MEMMDSVNLPFAQSTSEVDNRFNGWSAPLFKVALCPPDCRNLLRALAQWESGSGSDRFDSQIRSFFFSDDQKNEQKGNSYLMSRNHKKCQDIFLYLDLSDRAISNRLQDDFAII